MELHLRPWMLLCFSILVVLPTNADDHPTGSVASQLSAIYPTATLAAVSPLIWASENPSAFATYEALYTSIVLANPTALPSEFSSVADDFYSEVFPQSLSQLYATNAAAFTSVFESEFAGGAEPSWFATLPTLVQSYLEAPVTSAAVVTVATTEILRPPTVFATRTIVRTATAPAPASSPASSSSTSDSGGGGGGGSSGGLSTGAKAGIGIGVGVAALLAIIAGLWFFLRRRKTKKRSTTSVARQPEMAPAGAYHDNNQPQPPPHQSQHYGAPPQPGPAGYYAQQEPKYDEAYGGAGVHPGPYQQPYQQSISPPPQHDPQYYSSPPAPYGSPPPEGFYHEKSSATTSTGYPSPNVGSTPLISNTTGSSAGRHGIGVGAGAASELGTCRNSVESIRHEMPADNHQ